MWPATELITYLAKSLSAYDGMSLTNITDCEVKLGPILEDKSVTSRSFVKKTIDIPICSAGGGGNDIVGGLSLQ